MDSIGQRMRAARERKGKTVSEMANAMRTKMSVVESIEADDFQSFAAPIYARGFVRLYAECLGLNATAIIKELATQPAADNGRKSPVIESARKTAAPRSVSPASVPSKPHVQSQPQPQAPSFSFPKIRIPEGLKKMALPLTAMLVLVLLAGLVAWTSVNRTKTGIPADYRWVQDPPASYINDDAIPPITPIR